MLKLIKSELVLFMVYILDKKLQQGGTYCMMMIVLLVIHMTCAGISMYLEKYMQFFFFATGMEHHLPQLVDICIFTGSMYNMDDPQQEVCVSYCVSTYCLLRRRITSHTIHIWTRPY